MASLDIVNVTAEPLSIELSEPFGIASGVQQRADNVLVRVQLSDGSEGLGEAAPFPAVNGETQSLALAALRREAPAFVGRNGKSWRRLCQRARESLSDSPSALCALEVAMLDAWLKAHRCSMWSFFGGCQARLSSDITVPTGDVDAAVLATERALAMGYSELKIKIGAGPLAEDIQRLAAIAHSAPHASLILDANGAYSAEQALELLEALGPVRKQVSVFEQPTAKHDRLGLKRVLSEGKLDVMADESACSARDVHELGNQKLVSAVNIKTTKSGLTEALDMIAAAKLHGLKLMIGGMVESLLCMSASACIAGGLGGFRWVDLDTPLFMKHAPLAGGFARTQSTLVLDVIEMGHGVRITRQR
jgi:L-alanine-DL-glutamate epimerase-like enolase superfamily enzyme